MAKVRARGQRERMARTEGPVWVDDEGRMRTQGVVGDLEHGELMLEGRLVKLLSEWSFADLNRLAETIRAYAIGHELVDLRERVARLEQRAKPVKRRARRPA